MAKKKNLEETLEQEISMRGLVNPLALALRENDKQNLFSTNITTAYHKTGFPLFDYHFGGVVNIHDELGRIIRQEPRLGQAAGTFNLIVGNSGSGKTTFAAQLAANIIRQFQSGMALHFDCEQRFEVSRCETITGLPASYFHPELAGDGGTGVYIMRGGAIGLDQMQSMLTKLYSTKMKLRDKLTIDTGVLNEFNQPVMVMVPTAVIVDSITTVLSETYSPDSSKDMANAEKMRGNTEGARDAKTLKGFFKDVLPMCKEANIIIYGINHINSNMSMNSFIPVTKQQNFLKQDEIIPGGKTMIYYPHNIIKMTSRSSDNFTESVDGFNGHMVLVEPIKSSTNQSGNDSRGISFELVFSYKNGFDSLRSLILYGKENGLIEGNKPKMKFVDDPSFTFSFKNIYEEAKDKPIWESVNTLLVPKLEKHLSFIEPNSSYYDDRMFSY